MTAIKGKRRLFIAVDVSGSRYHIDNIDKSIPARFMCPYCSQEVIPKQGEKNIWHFAHKDQVCEHLLKMGIDDGENAKLDFKAQPSISVSDIDIGSSSSKFLCVKCKKTFNKEFGKKWDSTEYICNGCFNSL
ncbi:TPA: hypothetical protein HA265_03305 [Candidatus Woesearchaeota archaeon]|nr:hypothetical protein [Candidatus Woesearchaeota archaeon]